MKLIKEKKIPEPILIIVLYLSFCASGWLAARGGMALTLLQMPAAMQNFLLSNDIFVFFTAGIIPILLYELFTRFVFRFAQSRLGGQTDVMRYALKFFIIPANLISFGLKFIYFAFPIASVFGNTFIDFGLTTIAIALFIVYIGRFYVDKTRWGAMLFQFGGTYLIIYAVIVGLGLFMEVLL